MIIRQNVTSADRQPEIEDNDLHVYIRYNYSKQTTPATETEPEKTQWTYDEIFMTKNEYSNAQAGRLFGIDEWTDALREIERAYKYRKADDKIAKYSTDVVDEQMKQKWIDYKSKVRSTSSLPTYPTLVTYPEEPE